MTSPRQRIKPPKTLTKIRGSDLPAFETKLQCPLEQRQWGSDRDELPAATIRPR